MEKRSGFLRLVGVIYVIGAIFGLVISIGGLVVLWTTRPQVTEEMTDIVRLVGRTLAATSSTIQVINGSLDKASVNLDLIHTMTVDMAVTMDDSRGLIDSTASLVGNDLSGFFDETNQSLGDVQESARMVDDALRVVDNTLEFLSRIPLIGLVPQGEQVYEPRASLQDSVADVRRSMEPLPQSLGEIERQLTVSAANVAVIQAEVERLADEVAEIENNLKEARLVAGEYRMIVDELQGQYEGFEQRLPLIFDVTYLGLTLLLVWIFMTQLGMLVHGFTLAIG